MASPTISAEELLEYPCSDGQPMADNTIQARWMMKLAAGIDAQFVNEDVFVAADLFWYPIEGNNKIRLAPDILVALGRPRGDRYSYMQWKEGNHPPDVVMEVLSPRNDDEEMDAKLAFYERYGAREYYVFDPQTQDLAVYLRQKNRLQLKMWEGEWTSPLLEIRFDRSGETLRVFGRDGEEFEEVAKLAVERKQLLAQRDAMARSEQKSKVKVDQLTAERDALLEQLKALGVKPKNLDK